MNEKESIKKFTSFSSNAEVDQPSIRSNTYSLCPTGGDVETVQLALKNENLELQVMELSNRVKALREELRLVNDSMHNFDGFYEQAADFPILADFLGQVRQRDALPAELANYLAQITAKSSEQSELSSVQEALQAEPHDSFRDWPETPRDIFESNDRVSHLNMRILELEEELQVSAKQIALGKENLASLQRKYGQLEEYTRSKKKQYQDLLEQNRALLQRQQNAELEAFNSALCEYQPIVCLGRILDSEMDALRSQKTENLKMSNDNTVDIQAIDARIEHLYRIQDAIALVLRRALEYKPAFQEERLRAQGLTEMLILLEMQANVPLCKQDRRYSADAVFYSIAQLFKAFKEFNLHASKAAAQKAISAIQKLTLV